jgi:H+/Cl- antiporter ClcA
MTLLWLFIFNIVLEVLITSNTVAAARNHKLFASILSASIEPVKLVSLFIVFETTNRLEAVIIVSIACFIGSYVAIDLAKWWNTKLKRKRRTKQ